MCRVKQAINPVIRMLRKTPSGAATIVKPRIDDPKHLELIRRFAWEKCMRDPSNGADPTRTRLDEYHVPIHWDRFVDYRNLFKYVDETPGAWTVERIDAEGGPFLNNLQAISRRMQRELAEDPERERRSRLGRIREMVLE